MDKIADFFKNAFDDMAENTRIQHEADKVNFEAVRLESRSNREYVKTVLCAISLKRRLERKLHRNDCAASWKLETP